jgi:hypothetical protein
VLGDVIRPNVLMIFYSSQLRDAKCGRNAMFNLPCHEFAFVAMDSDSCLSRKFVDVST